MVMFSRDSLEVWEWGERFLGDHSKPRRRLPVPDLSQVVWYYNEDDCQIVKLSSSTSTGSVPGPLHLNHFSSSFLLLLAISTLLSWRWPLLTVDCVLIAQCYSDRCHHCHCLILQWRWLSNCHQTAPLHWLKIASRRLRSPSLDSRFLITISMMMMIIIIITITIIMAIIMIIIIILMMTHSQNMNECRENCNMPKTSFIQLKWITVIPLNWTLSLWQIWFFLSYFSSEFPLGGRNTGAQIITL